MKKKSIFSFKIPNELSITHYTRMNRINMISLSNNTSGRIINNIQNITSYESKHRLHRILSYRTRQSAFNLFSYIEDEDNIKGIFIERNNDE